MLKRDRQAFIDLVSQDPQKIRDAVVDLNRRELGHFEDHPVSAKLVRENLPSLVRLWSENPVEGCRDWVLQFVADAGVADASVKHLILAALCDERCTFLPTVLYLMSTNAGLFADVGDHLLPLANHSDREVRWRVAYFISKVPIPDAGMRQAIAVLSSDPDETTQDYVRACARDADTH